MNDEQKKEILSLLKACRDNRDDAKRRIDTSGISAYQEGIYRGWLTAYDHVIRALVPIVGQEKLSTTIYDPVTLEYRTIYLTKDQLDEFVLTHRTE